MDAFIKPYQMNAIRRVLNELLQSVYFAGDYRVYAAAKQNAVVKIYALFETLLPEQEVLFRDVPNVRGQDELNRLMISLEPYVIPFPKVTPGQLKKLFPKVKKLMVPDLDAIDFSKLTYLGWRDLSTKTIYIVSEQDGQVSGTRCRYAMGPANRTCLCSVCGRGRSAQEVGLVVAKSKVNDNKSFGLHMCLDSSICNAQITKENELTAFLQRLQV